VERVSLLGYMRLGHVFVCLGKQLPYTFPYQKRWQVS